MDKVLWALVFSSLIGCRSFRDDLIIPNDLLFRQLLFIHFTILWEHKLLDGNL